MWSKIEKFSAIFFFTWGLNEFRNVTFIVCKYLPIIIHDMSNNLCHFLSTKTKKNKISKFYLLKYFTNSSSFYRSFLLIRFHFSFKRRTISPAQLSPILPPCTILTLFFFNIRRIFFSKNSSTTPSNLKFHPVLRR